MRLLVPCLVIGCGTPAVVVHDLDRDGMPNRWDCDDRDPTTYPLAPERADEVDNDCNGVVDDLLLSTIAETRFTAGYRYTSAPMHAAVADVTGDPGADLAMSLPCGTSEHCEEAALVVVSELPAGDAEALDHASAIWTGLPTDEESPMFADADRVVVALPNQSQPGDDPYCHRGAVVGIPSPLAESGDVSDAPTLVGPGCYSSAGAAVGLGRFVTAGASIAIATPGFLFLAGFPTEGVADVADLSGARLAIRQPVDALVAGDIDGDGRDDLVVQEAYGGRWWVASDPVDDLVVDDLVLLTNECTSTGPDPVLGDLDGDGQIDLVLPGCEDAGGESLRVVTGPFLNDRRVSDAVPRVQSPTALFDDGVTVADFDGDGIDDLAYGAPSGEVHPSVEVGEHGANADIDAMVLLHLGPLDGVIDSYDLASRQLLGDSASQQAGRMLASGDLDGDGAAELLVGSLPGLSSFEGRGPILSIVAGGAP